MGLFWTKVDDDSVNLREAEFEMRRTARPRFQPSGPLVPTVMEYRAVDRGFPVVLEPEAGVVDITSYLRGRKELIERFLTERGAVLLRGFDVREPSKFFDAISEIASDILDYSERSSPRHAVADRVYTSTDHPADQEIVLHSEQSYTYNWPCFICFYCHTKAASGGNTPMADNRRILGRLPTSLVRKFETHGVLYQRTYVAGLGVSWQNAFQTENPEDVETFCKERDIEFRWDNEGRLKTRQVRSAFQHHPITGEKLWFNHALFFHVTSLDEHLTRALIDAVGYEHVPTNTFFGNGEPFSNDEIFAMRNAVSAEKRSFDWQRGDVLILDNMISQHGRERFSGMRSVYTLMARPYRSLRAPLRAPSQASVKWR